jgi:hypothetical protein
MVVQAISTSETLISFCQTTQCNIPEDSHLHACCCEILKSHKNNIYVFLCYLMTVFKLKMLYSIECNGKVVMSDIWVKICHDLREKSQHSPGEIEDHHKEPQSRFNLIVSPSKCVSEVLLIYHSAV